MKTRGSVPSISGKVRCGWFTIEVAVVITLQIFIRSMLDRAGSALDGATGLHELSVLSDA